MLEVGEHGATERASRHKHRLRPPTTNTVSPPKGCCFLANVQDYVTSPSYPHGPHEAPSIVQPVPHDAPSQQQQQRRRQAPFPRSRTSRRYTSWRLLQLHNINIPHLVPPAAATLQATYASLSLVLCLLLVLPPCADSLSRIRGQENVTSVTSLFCGPHVRCPAPPSSSAQCLVLSQDMAHEVCSVPVKQRKQKMRTLRLRFCDRYLLYRAIGPQCHLEGSESQCRECLTGVNQLDCQVRDMYRQFEKFLRVVEDCTGNFSTHWSCHDCKGAYRAWLCSTLVPYHERGLVIAPCSHFCETVENRCPYFIPHADTQYAGEPSFLCRDVSIRFKLGHTEVVTPKQSDSCYGPCRMLKEAPSKPNVNNYTMSSSDRDNELCYLKGRGSQQETSTATPPVTSQTMTSQLDASWLPTSLTSRSPSLRTHSIVLAQLLFWSIKTLTLHRDIGLT